MDATRLRSRKLWVTIIGSLAITIMSAGGVPLNIIDAVKWVLIAYLGAQGLTDLSKGLNGKKQ